jgi:3-oxoadipate enol-lactonase
MEFQIDRLERATDLIGPSPRIPVDYRGAGQPIILLQGHGGNRQNSGRILADLASQFFVMAWDVRGFDEKDDFPVPSTDADFVADLARVLDHFKIERCHLVGLSTGASKIFDFYDRHPDRVKSLVFSGRNSEEGQVAKDERETYLKSRLESLLKGLPPSDQVEEVLNSLLADLSNKSVDETAAQNSRASYINSMRCNVATKGRSEMIAKVTVPTLGIIGEHDRLSPPKKMSELIALIPGAYLEVIKSASHLPYIEQPKKFNQVLLEFLTGTVVT